MDMKIRLSDINKDNLKVGLNELIVIGAGRKGVREKFILGGRDIKIFWHQNNIQDSTVATACCNLEYINTSVMCTAVIWSP